MIIDLAKAVPIEIEIARRGIKLVGRGRDRCGPCPRCGGTDRFSINTKKQVWHCRGCARGGDVVDLVQHLDGVGFKEAVMTLAGPDTERRVITTKPVMPAAPMPDDDQNIERALRLWDEASEIQGTLAETYLRRRGLEPPEGDDVLRFYSPCPFGRGAYACCMLALYRNIVSNEPRAIMRTALGPNGTKIGRLSLGPVGGAAIKIDADENIEQGLHIGEGLETVLAARQLGFRPCWSIGSAGGIKAFSVLSGIDALTILVDHDEPDLNGRRAGQEAALECARRWQAAGKEVHRMTPRAKGADFADLAKGDAA